MPGLTREEDACVCAYPLFPVTWNSGWPWGSSVLVERESAGAHCMEVCWSRKGMRLLQIT